MQEINLLRSQLKDSTAVWHTRNRILTSVFVLVLILEVGLAALFFLLTKTTQVKKSALTEENRQTQSKINERQVDLLPARAFQAQLQNLGALVDKHIYWTTFFDELAQHTFSKTRFTGVQAGKTGLIHLEGEVSNYADMGKMLLALSTSGKFKDVKLIASSPSKAEKFTIIFAVELKINQDLLVAK